MKIDEVLCTACEQCIPYCPMGAIFLEGDMVKISQDECVECDICRRAGVCPVDALYQPELKWPRTLRSAFSNPLVSHPDTNVPGRGTEEMKTNEVTGRFRRGYAGIAVELGRPGTGARFYDVEKVATACAKLGVRFEPANPVTFLMEDRRTGKLRPEVLNEKVLSAIVEFDLELQKVPEVLKALKEVAKEIDTVFSLDLVCRAEPDGSLPTVDAAKSAGFEVSLNGKTNVGLGRPLKEDG